MNWLHDTTVEQHAEGHALWKRSTVFSVAIHCLLELNFYSVNQGIKHTCLTLSQKKASPVSMALKLQQSGSMRGPFLREKGKKKGPCKPANFGEQG